METCAASLSPHPASRPALHWKQTLSQLLRVSRVLIAGLLNPSAPESQGEEGGPEDDAGDGDEEGAGGVALVHPERISRADTASTDYRQELQASVHAPAAASPAHLPGAVQGGRARGAVAEGFDGGGLAAVPPGRLRDLLSLLPPAPARPGGSERHFERRRAPHGACGPESSSSGASDEERERRSRGGRPCGDAAGGSWRAPWLPLPGVRSRRKAAPASEAGAELVRVTSRGRRPAASSVREAEERAAERRARLLLSRRALAPGPGPVCEATDGAAEPLAAAAPGGGMRERVVSWVGHQEGEGGAASPGGDAAMWSEAEALARSAMPTGDGDARAGLPERASDWRSGAWSVEASEHGEPRPGSEHANVGAGAEGTGVSLKTVSKMTIMSQQDGARGPPVTDTRLAVPYEARPQAARTAARSARSHI